MPPPMQVAADHAAASVLAVGDHVGVRHDLDAIELASESMLSPSATSSILRELTARREWLVKSAIERHEWVTRIRGAIEDHGITTVYQPIADLRSGRTVGYEALSRFDGDAEAPAHDWFLHADAAGLLLPLERASLASALQPLDRLPDDVFLSVNLGPDALLDPHVLDLLAEHDLRRIVIELTEHAAIDDYALLRQVMLKLRANGLRLAVDDAGAGYASLRHIVSLAPDIIKLDLSLTSEVARDRSAHALTAALTSFAGEMNQLVIAEGVERTATVDALRAVGVHYGQGYLFGRPEPLAARPAARRAVWAA